MEPIASFSGLASGIQWRDMVDQIMKLEATRRLNPVTNRIKLQQQHKSAWSDYNSLVSKLRDASKSFTDGSAFGAFKTSTSNSAISGRALVSATANEKATPGTYSVEVLQLAQTEKLGSAEVADVNADLGLAGTFVVNGRAVTLASGESLATLRDKINAANAGTSPSGVTATILSTSPTSHRLILTANNSGSRGIELVDSDGVLKDPKLGIVTSTQTSNSSTVESGWTDSMRFSSKSKVLMDVLGVTPPPAVADIMVGGTKVTIDFSKDTLEQVLTKIQAADPLAKIREEMVGGRVTYRLSTSKTVAADPNSAASQRNLEMLGFVKNTSASQITAGQDAKFQVDGYNLTRRSNTVTDAIDGVTLNLLATDAASRTLKVTGSGLSITKEAGGIDAGTYAIALTTSTVTDNTAVDDSSYFDVVAGSEDKVAAGDYAVSFATQVVRDTSYTTNPKLTIGSAPSTVAAGDYTVAATFNRTTSASGTGVGINAAPTTTAVAGTYNVEITALATRASANGTQVVSKYSKNETLTITVGGKAINVAISANDSAAKIVSNLNTAFTTNLAGMQAVEYEPGKIRLEATGATGQTSQFTLSTTSSTMAAELGLEMRTYQGSNIQGRIGGVTAEGISATQLEVKTADQNSTGIVTSYTGSSTGVVGTVTVTDTISGATVNGQTATWDSTAKTFTFGNLVVNYDGSRPKGSSGSTHTLGTVRVVDSNEVNGGTINGQTASWNSTDKTLTLNGLSVKWVHTGTVPQGPINGTVTVTGGQTTAIAGATIGGEAAVWDNATKTIKGAVGSRFEGLELGYTGAATSGKVGDLTVEGDISVKLQIERDTEASTKKVQEFVDLYNKAAEFVKKQRDSKGPLASDGSLRAMVNSLRDVLFRNADGISSTNPYKRLSHAGVELTRNGTLELDSTVFKNALSSSASDVRALFAGFGEMMRSTTDKMANDLDGTIKSHQDGLSRSISSLQTREANIQAQLERRRTDLIRQFTAMEEAMSRLNSQGNWLRSQLSSIQGS